MALRRRRQILRDLQTIAAALRSKTNLIGKHQLGPRTSCMGSGVLILAC